MVSGLPLLYEGESCLLEHVPQPTFVCRLDDHVLVADFLKTLDPLLVRLAAEDGCLGGNLENRALRYVVGKHFLVLCFLQTALDEQQAVGVLTRRVLVKLEHLLDDLLCPHHEIK